MPSIAKLSIPNRRPNLNPRHLFPPLVRLPPNSKTQTHHDHRVSHITHRALFDQLRRVADPEEARKLHALALVNGSLLQTHTPVLGAQLVGTYAGLGRLRDALQVFDRLPRRNAFAWNSVLKGFVDEGRFPEALEAYNSMLSEGLPPDSFTYPLVLKACAELSALEEGRRIVKSIESNHAPYHANPNVFVQCAAINMFAKCGNLAEARRMFDSMPDRDLVSWTAMICGATQVGDWREALLLFYRMRSEGFSVDSVIVSTVLPACGRLGDSATGMGLHCCAVKIGIHDDLCFMNALIDMYFKCGYTQLSHRLFWSMKYRDVVSWSSLVAGYSQNCEYTESLLMYAEMIKSGISPSSMTIASVLPGLANLRLFEMGKEIHCYAIRHGFAYDPFVGSALVDFYCQCGSFREAELVSEIIPNKDISIWNSLIAGYALKGDVRSAFQVLRRVRQVDVRPNNVTVVTILPLCTDFSMLSHGKELHGYIMRSGLGSVSSVCNSLIDMYCKCGYLNLGMKIFEQMSDRNTVTYNTIIAAVGMHGHGDQAIVYFQEMKSEGIRPDKVTFVALLSACSHAGLIEKGLVFYHSMTSHYGILPDMEHYSCIVDLYGRSGFLDDAWDFIRKMPVEPDIDVLGSLLAACRVHKRMELAELIGSQIFEKRPNDPGYYILLSNIYASSGRWADGVKVRTMTKEQNLMKKPGTSWIQVGSSVHSFIARHKSHPVIDSIYKTIEILFLQMKDEGYSIDISCI